MLTALIPVFIKLTACLKGQWSYFRIFFTTDIKNTTNCKTRHVFRFLISSPKSPELAPSFLKWVPGFPKRVPGFPNWVPGFPNWVPGFPNWVPGFLNWVTCFPGRVTTFSSYKLELSSKDTFDAPWKDELRSVDRLKIYPTVWIYGHFQV